MRVGILGAGMAGLSSAYLLRDHPELEIEIFEASAHTGGMARSFEWHGFECDLAPHRLFAGNPDTLAQLRTLVPLHEVRRVSRIHIGGKWIQDPVNAVEVMLKFMGRRSLDIGWHYLFRPQGPADSFEGMVLNRFGKGLNRFFFKPYSEKLFGIPADQISPIWGERKIRVGGIRDMIRRESRLYFRRFYYPDAGGYGAICDRLFEAVASRCRLRTRMVGIQRAPAGGEGYVCEFQDEQGARFFRHFDLLISSLPLVDLLGPLGLALDLRFRPAIITYLLVDRPRVSDNHWFYLADASNILNRVAEFKNFNPEAGHLPADKTVLCCEVTRVEDHSVERVVAELEAIGLLRAEEVLDSKVIRLERAYPIYDLGYSREIERVEAFLADEPRLLMIGRNAQFEHMDVDEIYEAAGDLAAEVARFAAEAEEAEEAEEAPPVSMEPMLRA